jgi:hypothetical protein
LLAALRYVAYAKRVEPYAFLRWRYWGWRPPAARREQPVRDRAVAQLVAEGRREMSGAGPRFLRRRYAFQVLRLHFYNHELDSCAEFFEEHRARDFADGSSISWRALGYAAGAYYHAGRFAQANYLYSVVFDRCPPLRLMAAWSFRPQEEADWRESLALARSPRERAVLWQLLGISADGLRAMREIRAIDPRSDLLPLLLVREIARVELELGVTVSAPPRSWSREQVELRDFVEATGEAGDTPQPWLWDLAAGHLCAMSGDVAGASRFLDRTELRSNAADVRRQVRLSRLYVAIRAMTAADPAAESMLARELTWAKAQIDHQATPRIATFYGWARRRLSDLYREQGDLVTALCLWDAEQDPFYADSAAIDQLLAFVAKPNKTPFEALVASEYRWTGCLSGVKALNALYSGDFEQAAELFESTNARYLPTLRADPFEMHTLDNYDRDQRPPGYAVYTPAEVARRIAALLRTAEAGGEGAATAYYEAANALYNTTYYGNCRPLYELKHFIQQPRISDCSRAEALYRKAWELATDRELKAKAAFMAAKCEKAASYARDTSSDWKRGVPTHWFGVLRQELSDTAYYQEILAECGTFRFFLGKSQQPQSSE